MAQVPYNPDPSVGINPAPPSDYQRNVGSAAFQSISQLGNTVSKLGDFYNGAALDDQFNQLEAKGNELLYGNDKTPGYLTLNGKQAMDSRTPTQQSLDDWIKEAGAGFTTDQQKAAWDARAQGYRNQFSRTVGSHADTQTQDWAVTVNKTSAKLAMDRIAADPLNPRAVASGFADLQNAYIKDAQLAGASPGDEVMTAATRNAQRDALTAQVQAIGTNDPAKAMSIIGKNRDILGTDADNLYNTYRAASIATEGDALATQALGDHAATGAPLVRPPSQPGQPAWLDTYLGNIKGQESGGNPNAKSSTSSATGLYQFTSGTWRGLMGAHPELGLTPDGRTDAAQQERAVRAFTADNARALTASRVPVTPASLYLSAFFGAHGAVSLYDQPTSTLMEDAVGSDVIHANAWLRGKTVGDIRAWASRIAGKGIDGPVSATAAAPVAAQPVDVGHPDNVAQIAPVVPPASAPPAPPEGLAVDTTTPADAASAKATIIQNILDADDSDLVAKYGVEGARQVKQHAIAVATQELSALQVAADQTAAAKKAANETAMGGYVTNMLQPNANLVAMRQSIAADQNLTPETKLSLNNAIATQADRTVSGGTAAYGLGYWDAFQRILLPAGDPKRLSDPTEILQLAAPGPNGEQPAITLDGVQKLLTESASAKKSTDASAVQKAKASIEEYAKAKLSNQRDPNPLLNDPGHKDPVGEAAFNATFVPKFEAAFDAWVGAGKDPWEFLNKKNADLMMQGIRDPQEVAMQRILGGASPAPIVPAPAGVDPDNWDLIVSRLPVTESGTPVMLGDGTAVTPSGWAQRVQLLASKPTPDMMTLFDAAFPMGPKASDVLDALGIVRTAPPAAPVPAPLTDVEKANQALRDSLPMPAGQ